MGFGAAIIPETEGDVGLCLIAVPAEAGNELGLRLVQWRTSLDPQPPTAYHGSKRHRGEPEVRMDRRDFLTAAGSAATLTLTGTLGRTARADIHDLLSLLEETPRSQIIERVVARIRSGTSYEDLLAALTLATVRNVSPYPDVGFKYHAVMVLHAIHHTTMGMPPAERWLPMLWAVDYFKEEQADERHSSGWTMAARAAGADVPHPSPDQARSRVGVCTGQLGSGCR